MICARVFGDLGLKGLARGRWALRGFQGCNVAGQEASPHVVFVNVAKICQIHTDGRRDSKKYGEAAVAAH